jgi:hypothetical protein
MQARAGIRPAVPSSFFTMSNSPLRGIRRAAHLVPAAHFLRPGCRVVLLCLHRISPLHVPALRRARARILGVSCSSDPEMRGRRSAGRRTTLFVAPVRRDLTLARRARPAQPGRPPLGAPPWRCPGPAASPAFAPEPGQGWLAGHCSWPATDPGFDRGYEPRPTPHPAPPSGSSPETPLMSEDGNLCTIYSLRSQ